MRLLRVGKVHYERLINPVTVPHGPVGNIRGYLDHYPFSKGIHFWVERHNAYSKAEAKQIVQNRATGGTFSLKKAFSKRIFTSVDSIKRSYFTNCLFGL